MFTYLAFYVLKDQTYILRTIMNMMDDANNYFQPLELNTKCG